MSEPPRTTRDERTRSSLPIPDQPHAGLVTYEVGDPDTVPHRRPRLRPPEGAPNILLILLDDVGFGASSAFGGPVRTPAFERLAATGLRYNRFHTTALCASTRMALLSGRNHHSVGMGSVGEFATPFPGYSSMRSNQMATVPEILRLNGYATAQFGKCHEIPDWEQTVAGPFDNWPTGNGFEYFYGFLGGLTDQWQPSLYENTVPVEPSKSVEDGYHLTEDLADRAIDWIGEQRSLVLDRSFLCYFAPAATHAPHQVPQEWADKYRGQFDHGWDELRREVLARQIELGVIPPGTSLTERHDGIPAWDDISPEMKPVLCRQMELYAGFLEHADHHIGRVVRSLEELDILDSTLIYCIIGDNGASAEGTMQGAFHDIHVQQSPGSESAEFMIENLEKLGRPGSHNAYAVPWAHAMSTPFQWSKQVASHFGGTRNGLIVHWPKGIAASGEVRSQFSHVIDVAPTFLEVANIPEPTFVNGVQQSPIEGVSMRYSFDDGGAPDQHTTQYFEMFGNRGIYHKGWTAVTKHRTPWHTVGAVDVGFDDDVWELYDTNEDWSQSRNLAKEHPDQLERLKRLWLIEAARHQVLPLDDRTVDRLNPDFAERPHKLVGSSQRFHGRVRRISGRSFINVKNKSWSISAHIDVPASGAQGAIIAEGGSAGGWSFYAVGGQLRFVYNYFGRERYVTAADGVLPAGECHVRMSFHYDGGGLGKGGTVRLFVGEQQVGEGRVEQTAPFLLSAVHDIDVGSDSISQVTEDYDADSHRFNGRLILVQVDIEDIDEATLAQRGDLADRYRIAIAEQ